MLPVRRVFGKLLTLPLIVLSTAQPQPISIPPDEFFNGIDGQWSTFQIQVGTPGQTLRLLPGTSASPMSSSWVIDATGCTAIGSVLSNPLPPHCTQSRGDLFLSNESTTYSTQRLQNAGNGTIYSIDTVVEGSIVGQATAYFGFDTISLGLPGSGLPIIKDQVIGSLVTPVFWLGFLGLSPWPTNFTSFLDPQTSLLSTLYNSSVIPSKSWAYSAGAWYRDPPIFGSLTLGGYDATRFVRNNSTFAFGADLSRDLLVSLYSITSSILGQPPLLAQSIDIFIDSLIPEIWLPVSVCQQFATQFQLLYDNVTRRYLVDSRAHDALLASNPSFTFSIGQSGATGPGSNDSVDIVLPYAAFDLNVTKPIVNGTARYFPIRQAANEMQYILGRVFLQEAYVIADYGRGNFSVFQAKFPSTAVPQQIEGIEAPTSTTRAYHNSTMSGQSKGHNTEQNKLSAGAIAGVVVGCGFAVALIVSAVLLTRRQQRRHERAASDRANDATHGQGQESQTIGELEQKNAMPAELDHNASRHELDAKRQALELSDAASPTAVAELESRG